MEPMISSPHRKLYYGWVIVFVSMISMSFWFGLRTSFSVFFVALIDHFHWGRAEAAGAQSIAMLVYMITAPIIGTLVDRIGSRKVILPGILLTGLGLLLCTQIQTLTQFYLFFGLIVGIGVTCLSIAPFTIILAHWFDRKRGMANGLSGVGLGIGVLILVPFMQYLISYQGWRFAFLVFSVLILLIPLPLCSLFLKHRPQEIGLLPDGDPPTSFASGSYQTTRKTETSNSFLDQNDQTLLGISKTVRFWLVILFPALTTYGVYTVIVHQVRFLVDLGVDKMWAASLLAGIGAISAAFRPFWGWFSDRVGREITFTIGAGCSSSGVLFLILFPSIHSVILLYLYAAFFAAGWGVTTPMIMSITGDFYKGKYFGIIYGIVEGVIGISGAVGAWLSGYIFDQTQNYFWAFALVILLNLASLLCVWLAAPRKFRQIKSST